jgi:adenylate cyclase
MSDAAIDRVAQWLLQPSTGRLEAVQFVSELARCLNAEGIAVCRVSAWLPTLHPELWGNQLLWNSAEGCRVVRRGHDVAATADYLGTPGEVIHRDRVDSLRVRLDQPHDQIPYEILRDLAKAGGTDYLMLSLDPGTDRPPWIAFTTDRKGGFEPQSIARLSALGPLLSLHFRLAAANFATRSLLQVYLGANAARRVLDGEFHRGGGSLLRAALWFCDMRGFTTLSDSLPPRDVVRVLDQYFELVATPIEQHGGEILKFIGDAALAVFPIEGDEPGPACRRALAAAEGALDAVQGWTEAEPGRPKLAIGVGLHVGQVMYGNIGGRERLDFTVIGGSVNELCRVESLCKSVGSPLLMTSDFAAALQRDDLVVLGRHVLRGVAEPQEILTVPTRA